MIGRVYDELLRLLPHSPEEAYDGNGFWVNGLDEIVCPTEVRANVIADFFEDAGMDIMHVRSGEDDCEGWYVIYVDGQ